MLVEVARIRGEEDQESARQIRHAVFVVEQGVPAQIEVDGLDGGCDHYLARVGDEPVATARARVTEKGWKLERVAVLQAHRGRDVGSALVHYVLATAPSDGRVYVHAQASALGFWERVGFVAEGPSFLEGGLPHRVMSLQHRPR